MSEPAKIFTTSSGRSFTEAELMAMAEGLAKGEYTNTELAAMKKPVGAHPDSATP